MPAKRTSQKPAPLWVPLTWFAVAALIAFPLSAALTSVRQHLQLAKAVEVPARIVKIEDTEVATISSGVNKNGPMRPVVTLRNLDVSYAYTWEGREYTSSWVTTYQDPTDIVESLQATSSVGAIIPCFVDPDDPTLAVLNRQPHWKPMVGTAGLALMVLAAAGAGLWQGVLFLRGRFHAESVPQFEE